MQTGGRDVAWGLVRYFCECTPAPLKPLMHCQGQLQDEDTALTFYFSIYNKLLIW